MIGIRQILIDLIESVDNTLYINEVEDLGTSYKLHTCDTLHLRKGKTITIGSDNYTVLDFLINEYVIVGAIPEIPLNTTKATTYPVYPFSGTLRDTEVERTGFKQLQAQKVPFLWSREPFSQEDQNFESSVGTILDWNFFVLDECIPIGSGLAPNEVWYTFDHHKEVIEPMQNWLENRLIKKIESSQNLFGELDTKTVRGRVYLGSEDSRGNFETLFSENLSGVEVRISLPIMKLNCRC